MVESSLRKKASFSCDRCKQKKRRCVRQGDGNIVVSLDVAQACTECIKSNSICHTSLINRKQYASRYKCQLLGNSNISSDKTGPIESILLQTLKKLVPNIELESDADVIGLAKAVGVNVDGIMQQKLATQSFLVDSLGHVDIQQEQIVKDDNGDPRLLGSLGTPAIHHNILELIQKPRNPEFRSQAASNMLESPQVSLSSNFSISGLIDKAGAVRYADIFFENVNNVFICVCRSEYEELVQKSWQGETLSLIQSFLVLLVWLLGKLFIIEKELDTNDRLMSIYKAFRDHIVGQISVKCSIIGIRVLVLIAIVSESVEERNLACNLFKIAAVQATSVGIHRDVFHQEVPRLQKEYSELWWTIFNNEVRLSNIMGRSSSIDLDDVTISANFKSHQLTSNVCFYESSKLHQILYQFLKFKACNLQNSLILSSPDAIEKAVQLRQKLLTWRRSLPENLGDIFNSKLGELSYPQIFLHLEYHYCYINVGVPFLLLILRAVNSGKTIQISKDDPILQLAVSSINCSKQLYNIVEYEFENKLFNGSVHTDLYILYHGVLVLTIASILLKSDKCGNIVDTELLDRTFGISFDKLWEVLGKIRKLNDNLKAYCFGSAAMAWNLIDSLLQDLESFLNRECDDWGSMLQIEQNFYDPLSMFNISTDGLLEFLSTPANEGFDFRVADVVR
ncbi:hypothetical protein KL927_003379 [Ogataea polymorpha]|nr:hypothetical protein KL927_003379 [Ogataea polymorpha]